jgi:hypothetical protein
VERTYSKQGKYGRRSWGTNLSRRSSLAAPSFSPEAHQDLTLAPKVVGMARAGGRFGSAFVTLDAAAAAASVIEGSTTVMATGRRARRERMRVGFSVAVYGRV